MAAKSEIYKCAGCGIIVEVLTGGKGELTCCGMPMTVMNAKTADSATEKHVPMVDTCDCCTKVAVGSVPHPMEDDHYIEWIEIEVDGKVCRQYLKPGMDPAATFGCQCGAVVAREFCNKHGLWQSS